MKPKASAIARSEIAFLTSASHWASSSYSGASLPDAYVNTIDQAGIIKTLTEPTLTSILGERATLNVDSEYNVITSWVNVITYEVEKIDYGIGHEFQPIVLSLERIGMKIRTQAIEPMAEGLVNIAGGFQRS